MSLKLNKKKFGRKRFFSTEKIQSFSDWKTQMNILIDWLEKNTLFQRVGTEAYFYISGDLKIHSLMIEVLGKPEILDSNGLTLLDLESEYCYYYPCPMDQFDFTPETLLSWAAEVKEHIDKALLKSNQAMLCEFFLIVFNHEKLALQFFKKNDYIQIRP